MLGFVLPALRAPLQIASARSSFVCNTARSAPRHAPPANQRAAAATAVRMAAAGAAPTGTGTATASDAMLHFVYRVGDLERTRKFLHLLGLRVLRERDIPAEKYTNVFFGAGPESNAEYSSLELTFNYGVESYKIGDGFGHFGVAVPDVGKTVEELRSEGFKIVREPGPVKDGQSYMAFVEDPSGYRFELLQRVQKDPVCQITLRVLDLDKAIAFYQALGMSEIRRRSSEAGRYTNVKLGYGSELDSTVLQLTHNWDRTEPYDCGDGYGQIAVRASTTVYDTAKVMEEAGFKASRAPGPVPGIGTKIVAYRDPDNWKTVVVDRDDFESELK